MITLAVSASPAADPLIGALHAEGGDSLRIGAGPPTDVAWRLAENECDLALVSPLVYASHEGDLSIVGGASVSAVGPTGDTLLVFNARLHHIETVAYADVPDADSMLCEIILREKYHMRPALVAFNGSRAEALARYDAVLVRNAAADDSAHAAPSLDLVDEWFDMVQLPFVRQVVAGWDSAITDDVDARIRAAGRRADAAAIGGLEKSLEGHFSPDAAHLIPGHYRYGFDTDEYESLQTFFRYAFFHGLHRDIPLLKVWSAGAEAAL